MLSFLAVNAAPSANVLDVLNQIFSRADALAHPQALMEKLQSLSIVWALVFLIAGLVALLNGYRLHRWVIVLTALVLGLLAGYWVGQKINAAYVVAGCLGVLAAVTCFPLMKYAVAALGGLAGAFVGANAWTSIARAAAAPQNVESIAANYWVGALMGLIIFGMLSFVLFKLSIMLITTVSGSTLAVLGATALLLQIPDWKLPVSEHITAHAAVLPLLVGVPAVIGLVLQQSWGGPANTGKSEAKKPAS